MGHYSTVNGTVAGISGSQGGKAAASSTAWGNSAAGKPASGNMYAGHDGNVYKNTGNGWQKYDNGSWNSVNKPQPNWQGQKTVSNGLGAKVISNDRPRQVATIVLVQAQVATIDLARTVPTDPAEAGPIDQVEEITIDPAAAQVIWTARLRTGRVADNRANASRVFKAAAL